MKTQNTLENFRVYKDGELDYIDYAQKRAASIGGGVLEGLTAYAGHVKNVLGTIAVEVGNDMRNDFIATTRGTSDV